MSEVPLYTETSSVKWIVASTSASINLSIHIQGNLAGPPLGPPYDPRHRPTEGSYGGAFSYISEVPLYTETSSVEWIVAST